MHHLHLEIVLHSFSHLVTPFYSHFPGGPGLASTRMDFVGARMIEVVVTNGAIRRAKLQSNHLHQQTNTQLFTGRIPFL